MGMTITEKILAAHAGLERVEPGQLIQAKVDIALANDITLPLAIAPFREAGGTRVFDPERVVVVLDHFNPAKDIAAATMLSEGRSFARELGLVHFYDVGDMGIEHVLLPEKGSLSPAISSWARTVTPARTGPSQPFPQGSAARTLPRQC